MRIRMRIRGLLAASLLIVATLVTVGANATSANAAAPCPSGSDGPYTGFGLNTTHTHYCTKYIYGPATTTDVVLVVWGFDYNPASNHLRGFAYVVSTADWDTPASVSLTPLNLGDRNQVLKSVTYYNAQVPPEAIGTDVVGCHKTAGAFYLVNVHLTIVWGNGVYTYPQTGQLGYAGSTICR